MRAIRLQIDGEPVGKARPRFATKTKTGKRLKYPKAINVQATQEGLFLLEVKRQMKELSPLAGPLSMDLVFVMPIPKYLKKKKSFQENIKSQIQWHTKKPDTSNMVKFVEDCLIGLAYEDDSTIAISNARKFYGESPKTLITIKEID